MKKSYALFFLLFIISSLIIYISCSDSGTESVPPDTESVTTTISGTVLDEANAPIVGAEIKSSGQTAVTNASGGFTFSNIKVPKSRFVVNVAKTGYFDGSFADAPKANGTSNIKVYLMSAGTTTTVDAGTGGEATSQDGNSKVKLDANSVTNPDGSVYSGNVKLNVGYLDPTSENFSNLIPGGDLQATTTNNTQTTLYSYGIIRVEMKSDAGADLKIKSGNTSEITVDIPPSMEASAPATIPLWYYDDATGLWKEEGVATKNSQGDKYVGSVTHFSEWNCDTPEGTATVRGLVVDCNGLPVPGINVKIGQASANTGADGKFERRVPANTAFDVQVLGTRNFGLTSQIVSVPALAEGTIYDLPASLTVQCPVYVKGIIKCGTEIKYGQVVISWAGGYNSQYTDAEGKFNLPTAAGKDAEVSIYTFDGKYKTMNITTPIAPGTVLDLGVIEVCDQVVTGDNKFTVNGSGFNNRTFTFTTDTTQVYGYYIPDDTLTVIWMYQVFAPDTILYWFSFKGNGLGTPSEIIMWFYRNSEYFVASANLQGSSTAANITKYSGIGGLIEGTFSGTLIRLFGGTGSVTISNGQFSVVRLIGGSPGEKPQKDKIPIAIRKKLNLK